jgi:hypothetical protein
VARQHTERDIHIDPHTARTRWRGESMDYGLAIDVLLAKERKAHGVKTYSSLIPSGSAKNTA